jgi:Kef-type K+ transport system membrane component KefB
MLALAAVVAILVVVRSIDEASAEAASGAQLSATADDGQAAPPSDTLPHVLRALAAVMMLGGVLGFVFRRLGQPRVIGEVVAGILLGPSLLGRVAPDVFACVLPPSAAPGLELIAQFGVILYMFVVGLELDTDALRERARMTLAISQAGIVVPFALGAGLAWLAYSKLAEPHVSPTLFALFLGVAMSVTAFPVLARILGDRDMTRTSLGVLALGCAAVADVTAWCLLAFVVGLARANIDGAVLVIALTVGYIAVMFLAVRPLLQRWVKSLGDGAPSPGVLAAVFVALLASSVITELIGIHALFGAFALGAMFPHDSHLARDIGRKLEDLVTVLLLPAFFAFTGLRTQIGLVSGWENWLWCGVIIAVATLGKFGGTFAAARLTGLGWRESSGLGILMNTRGLMELIVLNIGLDLQIISPTVFAMLVLMALVTTVMTTPILQMISKNSSNRNS